MASDSFFTDCEVLHQDAALLVVNKTAGLLSHPNSASDRVPAVFHGSYDAAARCFKTPHGKLWLIHRLDEDTSGVLLAAKNEAVAQQCRRAFEEDRVRKHYLALVSGTGMKPEGVWLDHLSTSTAGARARTKVVPGARPNAELSYRVLKQSREQRASLLDIDLITGRTHQIRVQAAARRWPLLGDDVYGDFNLNRQLKKDMGLTRLCLHAHTLELKHPATGQRLKITAPLPADMAGWSAALGL